MNGSEKVFVISSAELRAYSKSYGMFTPYMSTVLFVDIDCSFAHVNSFIGCY